MNCPTTSERLAGVAPYRIFIACALVLLLVGGCTGRRGTDPLDEAAAEVRTGEPVPYTVTIAGTDEALREYLQTVSESVAGEADQPPSFLALRRRARADSERLVEALGGEGYYDGEVEPNVTAPSTEGGPAEVTFTVDPGERYTLTSLTIDVVGDAPGYTAPTPAELGVEIGGPAIAQRVLDAEAKLISDALAASYAYATADDRSAIIDREAKTLEVTLQVRPGPPVRLGAVTFEGTEGIDRKLLERRVDWKEGEAYTPELVIDTRRALVSTGLFRLVDVNLPETPPADGLAPVTIVTEQRKHRTISGGIRYESDAGPGADVAWEHRNIFGGGEQFRVRADVDRLEQTGEVRLRQPDIIGLDTALLSEAALTREDTDAFESKSATASIGLEKRFNERLDGSLGVGFDYSEVTDNEGTETFGLFFLPATLRYDNTDNPLDATRGVRARVRGAPFWDILNRDLTFQRVRLDGSTYFKVTESPRVVLAFRGALGSIVGADRDAIPANRRFYAGGGGSVRGIKFQFASPLDDDNEPIGGRSLLELSSEVRYSVTETIGVVGFIDAGRAFEPSFPESISELEAGAGLGLRYFTPVGPVRFDVAVPIDPRPFDDRFQIYLSLGQAF